MKKMLCTILAIITLSSCAAQKDVNDSSSVLPDTELDFKIEAQYNTENLQNQTSGGVFSYCSETDEIVYSKVSVSNDNYNYSIVARKGSDERSILEGTASPLTVFGKKLFYYDGENICSVDLSGNNKKIYCKAQSPLYIYPYGDGIFYREDFKIKYASANGKISEIDTEQKILNFAICNGCLYYGGFEDMPSEYSSLRCYNFSDFTDKLIAENITSFEIINGKIYAIEQKYNVISMELDGKNKQTLAVEENPVELYSSKKGLMYVVNQNDTCICKLYNEKSKRFSEIARVKNSGALCGDYLCSYSPYSLDGIFYTFSKIL